MPIELIALDIDHTLLDHRRRIHPANPPAIRRAVDAGTTIVLASGRFRPTMLPFAEELGLTGPLIAANGSATYLEDGSILSVKFISADVVDRVIRFAQEREAHLNVYLESELVFVNSGPWGEEYLKRVHLAPPRYVEPDSVRGANVLKLLIADDPAKIEVYHREANAMIAPSEAQVTESEPEYLEFLPSGCSKGVALAGLCASRGVDRSRVAAIGDFLNDVEMVEWAGFGGAVANAHPDLLARADVVVGSNEEGGVAQFIELCLAKR